MKNERPVTVIGLSGRSVSIQVERFARSGETILGRDMLIESGGKGYNQAIGLTRLGVKTTYISIIADDENGRICWRDMLKQGVSDVHFITRENASTSFASILRDDTGANTVTLCTGVSDLFSEKDVESYADIISSSRYLLLSLELPVPAIAFAARFAASHGVKVVLNPAPARAFPVESLRSISLLTPNETEAIYLLGLPGDTVPKPSELAQAWRDKQLGDAVVTLGARGALVLERQSREAVLVEAPKTDCVDTTGAGDAFNAALVAMLINELSLTEAAKRAVYLASRSVGVRGVIPAIPSLRDLDDYVEPVARSFQLS